MSINSLIVILKFSAHSILQRCLPFAIILHWLPGINLHISSLILGFDPISSLPVTTRVLDEIFFMLDQQTKDHPGQSKMGDGTWESGGKATTF